MTLRLPLVSRFLSCTLLIFFCSSLFSSIEDYYPYKLKPTSTNYGETGLLEMPSARFMEEGTLKLGISASSPYEYTFIAASPFPWFEAVYRYVEQKNVKYGPVTYSGNQSAKDKGFDLKFRLLEESYYAPNIAIGIRDMAGTGKFSGEYLVASKRFGPLDLSLGVGWGVLGADGNISNPLINLDERFRGRGSTYGSLGGEFNTNVWFSGDKSALYGGLEYSLYRYGLNLKLEYDTTHPDLGLSGPPVLVKSRFNYGVTRSFNDFLDVGLSYERGTELRFSFIMKTTLGNKGLLPMMDPPKNVIPLNQEQKKKIVEQEDLFYRSLNLSLREEKIYIQGASYNKDSVDIAISQTRFRSYPRATGRAARIASALSPEEIKEINIYLMNGDIEISSVSLNRIEFDKALKQRSSSSEVLSTSRINPSEREPKYKNSDFQPTIRYPEIFWTMAPALRHQIGGPEAFYLGQLWWRVDSTVLFRRGLSLTTTLGFDLYNNFNQFNNPSYSQLPHVRSDIQDYLLEGKNNVARMQMNYIWSPYKDLFARIDLGFLEEMFGGIGGEVYYRPFNSNFSASFQFHKVKQRGYKQRFKFRDYETETGHLGLHYDWPKGVHSQILIGKYLAGDKGATLDLSRRFKTGFTLGIFATKTNLSTEEFGEGSFDKGFYFAIPAELFYTKYSSKNITFGLHPLTKDGGAVLNVHNSLYGLFGDTNRPSLIRDWKDLLF